MPTFPRAHRPCRGPKHRAWGLIACAVLISGGPSGANAQGATNTGAAGVSLPANPELPVQLSLRVFVEKLLERNKTIRSSQNDLDIAATGVDRANATFQPVASLSVLNGSQRQQNTVEEELVRSGLDVYERKGRDYSVGLTQVLPTGAKLEGKATLSRFMTNIIQKQRPDESDNHRTYYGLSLTQPLARDAGFEAAGARLRVAELEVEAGKHALGDTEATVTAEAIVAYYDLMQSQRRLDASVEKVNMAKRLRLLAQELLQKGRLPKSDLWEVESSLARFESARSESLQAEKEQANRLRTMLMAAVYETPGTLQATEPLPETPASPPDFEASVRTALDNRNDFRMRKIQVERESVQLAYAHNQGLPRIDLVASYGLNGLDLSASKAFSYDNAKNFPAWSVGLQVSVPLGANLQAKADIAAADVRKKDALLALKALEVAIANDVDTSLGLLGSAAERLGWWREVAQRERQQLELEHRRLQAGRSDMREVLFREEHAINARLAVLEQQIAYAKARAVLQAAQGILIQQFR